MNLPAIDTCWKETYEARHTWAFRAYDDFMASLSEDVRQRLVHKDQDSEAFVVVFGKTQVGKTTLLMDLMGVSTEAMPRVSEVLRGGRGSGLSATATTMEYGRSPDDCWGFRSPDKRAMQWFKEDIEMTQALGDLRQAMEGQRLQAKMPCMVKIPHGCFTNVGEQPLVRMLDLPGDKPANRVEQAHVQQMADRYVRQADLILLVGRGDDLGFLKPGELSLPGIEDWQIVPDRFRIVTTYSFIAKTVRDVVRKQKNDPLDPEMFRTQLIGEIEKFIRLNPEARRASRFFPLEFGKSWQDTKRKDPLIYRKVSPLVDAFRQQLRDDIRASTTPMARLKGAVQAYEVVVRVKESRLAEMKCIHQEIGKKLGRASTEHQQAKEVVEKGEVALHDLQKRMGLWSDELLAKDLNEHFVLAGTTDLSKPDETVSGFKVMVNQARGSLKQRVKDSCQWHQANAEGTENKERRRFWRQLKVDTNEGEIRLILDRALSGFESHLNDYTGFLGFMKNRYISTDDRDSHYQKDIRHFDRSLVDAQRQLLEASRRWWLEAAKQKLAKMRIEYQGQKNDHAKWIRDHKNLKTKMDKLAEQFNASRQMQVAFARRMDKELTESRRFTRLLNESYVVELSKRKQAIVRHTSPSRRLIELLGAVCLCEARAEMAKVTGDEDK